MVWGKDNTNWNRFSGGRLACFFRIGSHVNPSGVSGGGLSGETFLENMCSSPEDRPK
jgi:hypothetical protein